MYLYIYTYTHECGVCVNMQCVAYVCI